MAGRFEGEGENDNPVRRGFGGLYDVSHLGTAVGLLTKVPGLWATRALSSALRRRSRS